MSRKGEDAMTYPNDYLNLIAKRKSTDSVSAWDGTERRANARHRTLISQDAPATSLDTKAIFREMMVHEIKNGTLSSWRRKRIVRYAAKMGLSAVEAGQLVSQCRGQAMRELDALKETPTLRVHIPETDDNSTANRVVIAVIFAILFNAGILLLLT